MESFAEISKCEKYRYQLGRKWSEGKTVNFIMLNPSTADANLDDPTIRRCISFAKKFGFGSLIVTNLWAYRSTDPNIITSLSAEEAYGPENTSHILECAKSCNLLIVAWGTHGMMGNRVLNHLREYKLWCLGKTKAGYPKHPLYLSGNTELEIWRPGGEA